MSPLNPKPYAFAVAGLQTADLLPGQFRQQRQVNRTIYVWATLVLASGSIFAGTLLAFWAQAKQTESEQTRLIADAAPLKQVRDDVVRMQSDVEALRTACSLVESAKPSDELLQTLAAIMVISNDFDQDVIIDSINVRLALEYPQTESTTPTWAESDLSIMMSFPDEHVQVDWIDRLGKSDRIEKPTIQHEQQIAESMRATLTATPVAITDLP